MKRTEDGFSGHVRAFPCKRCLGCLNVYFIEAAGLCHSQLCNICSAVIFHHT
jgi:hypothetical protein